MPALLYKIFIPKMESLDRLLAELKAEYAEEKPKSPAPQDPILKAKPPQPNVLNSPINSPINSLINEDNNEWKNTLADLKKEIEENDRALAQAQAQEKAQLLKQQQQKEAQERKALEAHAKKWLKQLDPLSDEGMWFTEFAYQYPSPLEAAIDYLKTLQS